MNNFRAWRCKFWILLVFVACYDRANATDLFVGECGDDRYGTSAPGKRRRFLRDSAVAESD